VSGSVALPAGNRVGETLAGKLGEARDPKHPLSATLATSTTMSPTTDTFMTRFSAREPLEEVPSDPSSADPLSPPPMRMVGALKRAGSRGRWRGAWSIAARLTPAASRMGLARAGLVLSRIRFASRFVSERRSIVLIVDADHRLGLVPNGPFQGATGKCWLALLLGKYGPSVPHDGFAWLCRPTCSTPRIRHEGAGG
jgi:hypothetical protein